MNMEQPSRSDARLADFGAWIEETMRTWKVPGLAVGIVRDGEVLFLEGFGVRDVEQQTPVTPNTLFALASGTKAFTTAALAMLADEGMLDWDRPVRDVVPSFKLYDAVATERLTPRDLVTHRSGLPRHDLAWYQSPFSRAELWRRLQYLPPNKDIRTDWQYQNLMYMAAGCVLEHIAGTSWEAFVRERIFTPLGMTRSNFAVAESRADPDHALPHKENDDVVQPVPFYEQFAIGPAGSINTCAADMTRWLLLHLGKGEIDGERLLSEAQAREMFVPQMPMPQPSKWDELLAQSYGLGWMVRPYRAYELVEHGGNINGFSTMTTLMPKENIGVVVLCNLNGARVPWMVCVNAYERLLGLEPTPWSERFLAERDANKACEDEGEARDSAERVADTRPSHALEAYAGEYEHPGYGSLIVDVLDDVIAMRLNTTPFESEHYHYDTWHCTFHEWDATYKATFAADARGDIVSVAVPFEPTVDDIVFQRVPPARLRARDYLRQFVGTYELAGLPMAVTLKGDALWVRVPGQPDAELVPRGDGEFRGRRLSGLVLAFRKDDAGTVVEAILSQGRSTLHAPRK